MSKVKVLFFAADPLSAPPNGYTPRLLLDEDLRQILAKVRAAEYRDALEFDPRLAARTDDLLQALHETQPQVVHFSGHGGREGLVLVGSDGYGARSVDAAALAQLFRAFRGNIRVVVLNACFSLPQAEAIARVVGCAIGTRGAISDVAAITFAASFYRAIAFGESVRAAFDQARAALALEHFEERECPQLAVRTDVDPARLVLVPHGGMDRGTRRLQRVAPGAWLALAGAVLVASVPLAKRIAGFAELPPADSAARSAHADTNTVLAVDSPAPAVRVRERTVPRQHDKGGQPAVVDRRDAGAKPDEPLPAAVDPSTVHRHESTPDTSFARLIGTKQNPMLPPVSPR